MHKAPALPPTLPSVHDLPILLIPDDNIDHTNPSGIVFSDIKLQFIAAGKHPPMDLEEWKKLQDDIPALQKFDTADLVH